MIIRTLLATSLICLGMPLIALDESVKIITKQAQLEALLNTSKPVIVDVFASWCGPCKRLAPVFAEFAELNKDKYVCAKIDWDNYELEAKQKLQELGAKAFPTLLVFVNKKFVGKHVGFQELAKLKVSLENIITPTLAKA